VFAKDPSAEDAVAVFRKATAGMQVGMTIVRLMRNGMFVEPAAVHARAELKVM